MKFFDDWKNRLIGFVCLFFFIFLGVTFLRQCSESTQTVGNGIAVNSIQTIKENKEIELLTNRVENLENQIAILEYKLIKIDSLRNENFRTTPNKSIRSSYSDITKRYK